MLWGARVIPSLCSGREGLQDPAPLWLGENWVNMRVGAAWHRAWHMAGPVCLHLPAAHKGTLLTSAHGSSQTATALTLLRSRRLEEEQQAALAALSEQLEAISSVEELTKLVSDPVLGQTVCWDGADLVLGLTLLLSWVLPSCSCGQRVSTRSAS